MSYQSYLNTIINISEDDDGGDTASEVASTMSERTGYSVATDTSTAMSVQDALNSK